MPVHGDEHRHPLRLPGQLPYRAFTWCCAYLLNGLTAKQQSKQSKQSKQSNKSNMLRPDVKQSKQSNKSNMLRLDVWNCRLRESIRFAIKTQRQQDRKEKKKKPTPLLCRHGYNKSVQCADGHGRVSLEEYEKCLALELQSPPGPSLPT